MSIPIVLHPLSRFSMLWDLMLGIVGLWAMVEVPLMMVYDESPTRYQAMLVISAIFTCTHVFLETRTLVLVHGAPDPRPSKILREYLVSKRLVIDLISIACLPLEVFVWRPLGLLCCVRLYYIWRVTSKVEKTTKMQPAVVRAVRLVLLIAPAFHWLTCIVMYLMTLPGAWSEYYLDWQGRIPVVDPMLYFHAFYLTMELASRRGASVRSRTSVEVAVSTAVMALSTLLFGAIIANLSTWFLQSDLTYNDHCKRVEVLKAFMRAKRLPIKMRQKILSFLDYLWSTQKGLDERQILQSLPASLQEQVMVFCAQHVIAKVPLFNDCSPSLCANLIRSLEARVYVPQDCIFARGDWGDEFFIVNHGAVMVMQPDNVTPAVVLRDGAYFGELAALLGGRRQRSVVALTHCFLSSLKHSALDDILKASPEAVDKLISNLTNSQVYDTVEVRRRLKQLAANESRLQDDEEDDEGEEEVDDDFEDDMSRDSSSSRSQNGGATVQALGCN